MALLDAIFEGLVDEENGALRDFCALAVREFLVWSVKHVAADAVNLNAASLLRRLFERLAHPKPYQRHVFALSCTESSPALLPVRIVFRIFRYLALTH